MKKILYLLVALLPLWCVSCSDDDDDEPVKTKDGKRLVAKVIEVSRYDDRFETTFEYNKNAQLEKFIEKDYIDDYLEEEFSMTFTYSSDKIVGKGTGKWDGETTNHTATFILNGQGYISEYEVKWNLLDEDEWTERGTFIYNNQGQLIKATHTEEEENYTDITNWENTWENDELVKEVRDGRYIENYSYSDKENKTYIDFHYFLQGCDFYLECMGYLGKATSKYLPENLDGEKVSYKFDDEGYPIEIEYKDSIYTIEYK